jgi:hypothetical protein
MLVAMFSSNYVDFELYLLRTSFDGKALMSKEAEVEKRHSA